MFQHSKSEFLEITIDDNESKAITHNGIEITIDRKKCNYSMYDPTGCRKCIQLCTPGVLTTRPIEKRDFSIPPKERIDPTKWILMATWADWCNGCGICIKECPKDAINIKMGDRVLTK